MTVSEVRKEEQQLNMESVTLGDLTWVNIRRTRERETQYLAKHYPFHPLDLDDCLSRIQRPFIGENYLITLHKGELKPLVKLFKDCQTEEESLQANLSQGSGYLLYRIIDRLVDYCFPILNRLGANIEDVEDNIFADGVRGTVREISVLRRDVISFRRIIWPMRAVIGGLEPKIRRFTKMDMAVYFGDMIDHVDKIWDALDEYKEIIEGLNDTHDSLATNRTNEVVRTLTVIATILLPITVVASIYGMNIPLPFQNSTYSLLLVLLIMLVIISGMLYIFRRKHVI
jgi:magnesium transporter